MKEIYTKLEVQEILKQLSTDVLITSKCDNIDESISTCSKDCSLEYDECCRKWKQHWTKYDEGLNQASSQILDKINDI